MTHSTWRRAQLAVLVAASIGCSSAHPAGPADFGSPPYTTTTSDSGALSVAVRTWPQPPTVGTDEVQLTITRTADGTPVDGLTIDVEPWMPSMGHGTANTTVSPQGGGVYLVTDVYLYMPGLWQLRTTVSGPLSDHVEPQLTIQ